MVAKEIKNIDLNEDLHLFDESDWDFLGTSDSSIRNFDYFSEVHDSEFMFKEPTKAKFVVFIIFVFCLGVSAVICSAMIYRYTIAKNLSSNSDVLLSQKEVDNSKITYVSGDDVSSKEFIEISKVFNTYFSSLKSSTDLSSLNNTCTSASNFVSLEEAYRTSIKFSYDSNDCYARALREYGRYISIKSLNKVVKNDGKLYCYMTLEYPDISSFYEYYMGYSYEMTKYFSVNTLNSINVTKYMLQITSNNNVPLVNDDFVFTVSDTNSNGVYTINDDSQITNLCSDAYISSINNITNILGGTLVKTQY